MAQQKINPTQIDTKLLANVLPSSSFSTSSGSSTYMTTSNTAFTVPLGGATVMVLVDISVKIATSGSTGQAVVQLKDAASGGGSVLRRRVPGVATNDRYSDASMSYVVALSAGSYTYSLAARTSTGATSISTDTTASPQITVHII